MSLSPRRALRAAVLPLALLGGLAVANPQRPATVALWHADNALSMTEALRQDALAVRDRAVRTRMLQRLDRLETDLLALRELSADAVATPRPAPPVRPAAPPRRAISDAELADILRAIDAASFSDGKIAVLDSAARDRAFRVAQVVRILDAFSFGSDKVEAGARLYPQVIDPQDWYRVYEALDFTSDREALKARTER